MFQQMRDGSLSRMHRMREKQTERQGSEYGIETSEKLTLSIT